MSLPNSALVIIILVIGFLSGSSLYFYNKSRSLQTKKTVTTEAGFQAEVPQSTSVSSAQVDSLTQSAEPRGRLSYPANIYKVQPKETLFTIGEKMGLPWQRIAQANGLTDENVIQAGFTLAIPKLDPSTDYYRLNFLINQDKASELNRELRESEESEWFDPVKVAKSSAISYFGIQATDTFSLIEADLSKGTSAVEVKNQNDQKNVVGLIQPKVKGKKGFWAVLYVERHGE